MLMMALAPVIGVVLAWIFLDEQLAGQELLGIALAVGGIAWVVGRDGFSMPQEQSRHYLIGILCGLGGATGQAGGLVLSKLGLKDDFPPLSGNVIRLIAASFSIWLFTIVVQRQATASIQKIRERPRALKFLGGAVVAGPVFGVWMSLIAVQKAPVGVASTLMSLTPIFLLPVGYWLFQEKITVRAIVGTGLAIVGTAVLFL